MTEHDTSACLMWPATFPGSETVEEPHCTVLYLGEQSSVPLGPHKLLLVNTRYLEAPGEVAVVRLDIFGEDDEKVWVAILDDSAIGPLRSRIKTVSEWFGVEDASSYPEYRPHVTLAPYAGEDSRPLAPDTVTLGSLEAWWGNKHVSPISGE